VGRLGYGFVQADVAVDRYTCVLCGNLL
jgi:hypothetical protein